MHPRSSCLGFVLGAVLLLVGVLLVATPAGAHPAQAGYDERTGFPLLTECYCRQGATCACHGWYVALRWDDHAGPGVYGPFGGQATAESALAALRRALPAVVEGAAYCASCRGGQYRGTPHPLRASSEIVDSISSSTYSVVLPAYNEAAGKVVELLRGRFAAPEPAGLGALEGALKQYGRAQYAAALSVEPLQDALSWWGMLPDLGLPRERFYAGFPSTLDPVTGATIYWSPPPPGMANSDYSGEPAWGPVFPLGADGALLQPLKYRDAFEARLALLVAQAVDATNALERAGYALHMADYELEVAGIRRANAEALAAWEASEQGAGADVVIRIEDDFGTLEQDAAGLAPATAELAPGITISLGVPAAPVVPPPQDTTAAPGAVQPPAATGRWAQYVGSYTGAYDVTDQHGWEWHLKVELEIAPAGGDALAVSWRSSGFSQGPGGQKRQSHDYSGSAQLSASVIEGSGPRESYTAAGDIRLGDGRCCITLLDGVVVFAWDCALPAELVKVG